MAFNQRIGIKLLFNNLDHCQIGDEGCEYLSRGQWPEIEWIHISLLYYRDNN